MRGAIHCASTALVVEMHWQKKQESNPSSQVISTAQISLNATNVP